MSRRLTTECHEPTRTRNRLSLSRRCPAKRHRSAKQAACGVATYGKQLGRIGDALIVLLKHFNPPAPLSADEKNAIAALNDMLGKIAAVKKKHGRTALRP